MATVAMPRSADVGARARGIALPALPALLAGLFGLFALDNVLLLGFLGWPPLLVAPLGLIVPLLLARLVRRWTPPDVRIGAGALAACVAVAAVLLLLGGEGRLFYANPDWQIRDAVLADLGRHAWPFDYALDGIAQTLRAPLGLYLVPAIVGGGSQLARDWALFAHDLVMLSLLFASGAALFDGARARVVGLIVFVAFSGLDVVGTAIWEGVAGGANWDHLERWAPGTQYSAHLTQLFWVPQHGLAGWTCALAYLLWRRGAVPVGLFGASIPLVALWSPLAVMGAVPFALFAIGRALFAREWTRNDVVLTAFACLIALPALAYLATGAAGVGGRWHPPSPLLYGLIALLEVAPLVLPSWLSPTDRPSLAIATLCLLLMPLWMIGQNADFQMRASIMPLAVTAVLLARRLAARPGPLTLAILALGSVTGAAEVARAIRLAPSPPPLCSVPGAWAAQSGMIVPHASYFAPTAALRPLLGREPHRVGPDPRRCWSRPWRTPR